MALQPIPFPTPANGPGMPLPASPQVATNMPAPTVSAGGMIATPLATVQAREAAQEAVEASQSSPLAVGIAAEIKNYWDLAQMAKRNTVESTLLAGIRSRRGQYDPQKMAAIRQQGGSEVFAGLTSAKCRAAGSWIRDVIAGTGADRPWTIKPTPVPTLPPEINDIIVKAAEGPIMQAMMMGVEPPADQLMKMMSMLKDQAHNAVVEEATKRAERMADLMEDQMQEGDFYNAIDAFIDDLTTYPTAFLKGPVIRKRPVLSWGEGPDPIVEDKITLGWERVSPFDIYPSPSARDIQDGYLIHLQHLTRQDLNEMIGVDGYNDDAIKQVLTDYGTDGYRLWSYDQWNQAEAEGKDVSVYYRNADGTIDALQYWGSLNGQKLLDWGMSEDEITDPTREYQVEAWLIGPYVIKAVLNYDPLGRRPYYAASYENIPGSLWGTSVATLVSDVQDVVNACARSLINNMALASGPQVGVLVDRLAAGEDITQLSPWRIWQMKSDPLSGTSERPIEFFQPQSNVNDLLIVFEKFSQLGDEYSGIPRYLTGETSGGAGRTASGLSMLISNAGKSIKQVVTNIDKGVMQPMLEKLYYHNMRYGDDPELKGDVQIIARGASALVAKESAQVRRNEFLLTTANPIDQQIMGVEGRASVLREVAKGLDIPVDKVVPSTEMLREKAAIMAQMAAGGQQQGAPGGASPSGQSLADGAPVTDNFGPASQ